ncbi:expressed unknown protein [Seminavis robusta]|uniref:Uncharacterized protein n=1 Tax=Seminavis robusta TaxID=568900 RepID=A0A9N8EAK3_9STRA|nr:expressed unknown protein [Seminavis robusta]|eukprot:Sro731_g194320.1 n/a (421) ;mRNA; f:41240-42502
MPDKMEGDKKVDPTWTEEPPQKEDPEPPTKQKEEEEPPKQKKQNDVLVISTRIPRWSGTIFILFSRAACITYVILAGFTFPEIQKLHKTQFTIIGETYHVPIAICEPGALSIGDTTIFQDVAEIAGCRTMDVLINSCASSLILSAVAVLIYVVIDLLSRCHHGMDRGSVSGMGIFLLFIVFQASSTTWALAEESDFWSDYMSRFWKEQGFQEDYPIVTRVHTYGNEMLLWSTGSVGAAACILIFFESMANLCCSVSEPDPDDGDEDEAGKVEPPNVEEEPNKVADDPKFPDIDIETGKKQETPTVVPTVIISSNAEPEIDVPSTADYVEVEHTSKEEPDKNDDKSKDDAATPQDDNPADKVEKTASTKSESSKKEDKPVEERTLVKEVEPTADAKDTAVPEEEKEATPEPKAPVRNTEHG